MKLSLLKLAGCLMACGLFVHASFGSTCDKQNSTAEDSIRNLSDEQLVQTLSSSNWVAVDRAVLEIMRRGDRMIDPLLTNRGNTAPFRGYRLGMEDPEKPFPLLPNEASDLAPKEKNDDKIGERKVSENPTGVNVEVASLYLINAIYFNDIAFAPYPHLLYTPQAELWENLWRTRENFSLMPLHLSIAAEDYDAYIRGGTIIERKAECNTPSQVAQAWDAVEIWIRIRDKVSLAKLRKMKHDPLKDSGVKFVYIGMYRFRILRLDPEPRSEMS